MHPVNTRSGQREMRCATRVFETDPRRATFSRSEGGYTGQDSVPSAWLSGPGNTTSKGILTREGIHHG